MSGEGFRVSCKKNSREALCVRNVERSSLVQTMREPKLPTREECLWIADEIRDTFTRYGVTVSPGSDIDKFIQDTRWLADHLCDVSSSLTKQERERGAHAFVRLEQARHVAFIFKRLQTTQIPREKLRILNKRLDRLSERGESKARDILFELEVAGRLARQHPKWTVVFKEPDLAIQTPVKNVGLACKRPRSKKRLSPSIREAADQCVRSGLDAFVIVGTEEILQTQGFLYARTLKELEQQSNELLNVLFLDCYGALERALGKGAAGVMLCCRFVGLVGDQPNLSIQWTLAHRFKANPNMAGAHDAMKALGNLMEQ